MAPRARVCAWSAWAPGVTSQEAWTAWAAEPYLPTGDDLPSLTEISAMQRRRLSTLGRAALQVASQCADAEAPCPAVFASRYGDLRRSLAAIELMVAEEPVSPTSFATSVHNAIAAVSSIARGHMEDTTCVAAGPASAAAGFIEAAALLGGGAERALLVCYDEPVPAPYDVYADEPPALWAWAWLLGRAQAGEPAIGLRWRAIAGDEHATTGPALPAGLQVLQFFVTGQPLLRQMQDTRCWEWWRDG